MHLQYKLNNDLIAYVFNKKSCDSVDVIEEPAAEPISTHGDGWVPISINQVIKTISEEIDSKVELTTPIGAKYLEFFLLSFSQNEKKNVCISFAQFVYFLREVCLLFNF